MRLSRQIRARIAWLKSFTKRRWTFDDYPVDYIDQGALSSTPRFQHHRWRADMLGLHITGLGDTQEAALSDAMEKFAAFKSSDGELRRPGSRPKIEFAASNRVDLDPPLREHFINTVLHLEWAFVSDESSLWDFHMELDNSQLLENIWRVYGVDASHITSGNIANILAYLKEEIREFPEDEINRAIRMDRDTRDRWNSGLASPKWVQNDDDAEYSSCFPEASSNH